MAYICICKTILVKIGVYVLVDLSMCYSVTFMRDSVGVGGVGVNWCPSEVFNSYTQAVDFNNVLWPGGVYTVSV